MRAGQSEPYTPFSLTVVPNRREVAVTVVGELDLASADEVAQAIAELAAAGFAEMVLDLRRVDFIDSAGLRMLLGLRNDATRNGHRLLLVSPESRAQRIFDLTGTRGFFDWRGPSGN